MYVFCGSFQPLHCSYTMCQNSKNTTRRGIPLLAALGRWENIPIGGGHDGPSPALVILPIAHFPLCCSSCGMGEGGGGGGGEGGLPLLLSCCHCCRCWKLLLTVRRRRWWPSGRSRVTVRVTQNPCHGYGFLGDTEFPIHTRTPEKPAAKPMTFPSC